MNSKWSTGKDNPIQDILDLKKKIEDQATFPSQFLFNLGYQNGWGKKKPEIYRNCREKGHKLTSKRANGYRGETTYSCPICGYYFKVDSGG